MCADLSDADLNAIRKARGFSASETASRNSFASFYVTTIGVDAVIQTITPEEAITLRMLHETGEVDVAFFERTYGGGNSRGTYTQRYKTTFDAVKKNLVRKGLLVMAETKLRGDSVQMERWRFAIPTEFVPCLPPLLSQTRISDQPGETSDRAVRKKLLRLVGGGLVNSNDPTQIQVQNGSIWLGAAPFSVATLREWQMLVWQIALVSTNPATSTLSILSNLAPGEWIAAQALGAVLKIYGFGSAIPPVEKILKEGWELGFLSRLTVDSTTLYRLAPGPQPAESDSPLPDSIPGIASTSNATTVKIDLRLIPLQHLEILNSLAHISIEDGALCASPSLVKLGRAIPAQRNSPFSCWLAENFPAFGKAAETVNAKWGKTILHENLFVACVRDLSLRVQLERELKEKIVILDDHFIAFPLEARSNVEKVLKKTGFVTKTIKP